MSAMLTRKTALDGRICRLDRDHIDLDVDLDFQSRASYGRTRPHAKTQRRRLKRQECHGNYGRADRQTDPRYRLHNCRLVMGDSAKKKTIRFDSLQARNQHKVANIMHEL